MSKVDTYERRIHDIFPELSIEKIKLNDTGSENDIIEVNDELIFRFPKHEIGIKKLNKEVQILKLIKKYITLNIPRIFYEHREVVGYFMICGVDLSKDLLGELDEKTQQLAANQLATFLKELHNVPKSRILLSDIYDSGVTHKYKDWGDLYQRLSEEAFQQGVDSTQELDKSHLVSFLNKESNFDYEPKLIHGNLGECHILFDKQKNCISGIIDFGTAGLGDPAIDIAILIHNYGEAFVSRLYQIYPEVDLYLKRAKFYAETFALPWVLSGIKSRDITEFLRHLGGSYKS